jgi:hypothetical protein
MEIKASADGSTIYVGGDFDQRAAQSAVASSARRRPVRYSRGTRCELAVDAIAVTNSTIYFGGDFTPTAGTGTGYPDADPLAAADAVTGAILPWNPSADKIVFSMVYHPGTGRVIVAGTFNTLNGSNQPGMGSLDGLSGTLQPWAANKTIINHDGNAAIGSLTTDGEKIFGIGWAYFGGGGIANFEGAFSADPATGVLDWVDGGRGTTTTSPSPATCSTRWATRTTGECSAGIPSTTVQVPADHGDRQAPVADADQRVRNL